MERNDAGKWRCDETEIRAQKSNDRGQEIEVRSRRKKERDSPVGAAFSRDLAL
jgi:hypothetical protein